MSRESFLANSHCAGCLILHFLFIRFIKRRSHDGVNKVQIIMQERQEQNYNNIIIMDTNARLYDNLEKELAKGIFNALRPNSYFESGKGIQLNDYVVFEFITKGVNSTRTEEFFNERLLVLK